MKNIKKTRFNLKAIVILFTTFILCLTGFIISTTLSSSTALAYSTGPRDSFNLHNSLNLTTFKGKGVVYVSVTQSQYDKLNVQNTTGPLGWVESCDGDNVALFRVKHLSKIDTFFSGSYYSAFNGTFADNIIDAFNATLESGEFLKLYHMYPTEKFPFEQISVVNNSASAMNGYLMLPFELSMNYSTEFYYVAYYVTKTYSATDYISKDYYTYNFVDSSGALGFKESTVAKDILENNSSSLNSEQAEYLRRIAGISLATDTFTVNLVYKEALNYGHTVNRTETYLVDSLYCLAKEYIWNSILYISGRTSIYDFNCILNDGYQLNSVEYITNSRILYQAKDYTYTYNTSSNVGTLQINYYPFQLKDFAICVRDNDTNDSINLVSYIYFTDVSLDSSTRLVTMRLPFAGDNADHSSVGIKNMLFNGLGWITDEFTADDFVVGSVPSGLSVNITDSEIIISFNEVYEELLGDLSIMATAEIIPDYSCTVNVKYAELTYSNGDIFEKTKTLTNNVMYSEYIKSYVNAAPFFNMFGEIIKNALTLTVLNGQEFYIYDGITCSKDGETTFSINVNYRYNTLMKCTSDNSYITTFHALTSNSLIYYASDFDFFVPDGYQIQNLVTPDTNDLRINYNAESPNDSMITLLSSPRQAKVLTLHAEIGEVIGTPDQGDGGNGSDTDNTQDGNDGQVPDTDTPGGTETPGNGNEQLPDIDTDNTQNDGNGQVPDIDTSNDSSTTDSNLLEEIKLPLIITSSVLAVSIILLIFIVKSKK